MKYTVDNDRDFYLAVKNSNDGDEIIVCPGEYFDSDDTPLLSIENEISIVGETSDPDATRLNCGFIVGDKNIFILNDLSVNYNDDQGNALALYDGAEFYSNNVVLNHSAANEWNTIYCQNSSISLKDSEIINSNKDNIPAIMMENSQMFAVNSSIYFPALRASDCILKDSFISYSLCLQNKSSLKFDDITIDSNNNTEFSDFYLDNESTVEGSNITFIKDNPSIDILASQFETNAFLSDFDKINWRFDDESSVWADGYELLN